jgi:hypothetical protein
MSFTSDVEHDFTVLVFRLLLVEYTMIVDCKAIAYAFHDKSFIYTGLFDFFLEAFDAFQAVLVYQLNCGRSRVLKLERNSTLKNC